MAAYVDSTGVTNLTADIKTLADATYPANEAIAEEYDSTASYAVGDFCIHEGLLYQCTTAISSGGEAWNSSHWTLTNVADNLGTKNVVYIGTDAPTDPNIKIWLDTDEPGMSAVSSVNAKTGAVVIDADDVGAMQSDLLWTNASPGSGFSAQTISLDLSSYSGGIILFRRDDSTNGKRAELFIGNGSDYTVEGIYTYERIDSNTDTAWWLSYRYYTVTTTGITFTTAYYKPINTSYNGAQSLMCIPYKIYGLKW